MHAHRRHPSSRPFMAVPRVQFYHPAKVVDAGLQGIERAIRRAEGIALIVGQPGTGKSLLLAMVAEHVREDFDVALLSGARICTRRALWQAILAEIGEPYRGIDEGDLRIAVVERIRGLAATGAGLVILVDEAQTLPTRLLEELRLLTNVPTPLPAVHVVLAGPARLEESLAQPRMESLAQRIAVRVYLEPLDHAESCGYLRAQVRLAGLDWDALFEVGSDDAVFAATDGVPRLMNQLCDHALLAAGGRRRVSPADVTAAWREIQRLPAPASASAPTGAPPADDLDDYAEGMGVIEFGGMEDLEEESDAAEAIATDVEPESEAAVADEDPWSGPDVELVFDAGGDPFAEFFEQDAAVKRYLMRGPDDFRDRRHVSSREGDVMGRLLESFEIPAAPPLAAVATAVVDAPPSGERSSAEDDADMVVVEEDLVADATAEPTVLPVRSGDYRSLFTRLRRGL